MSELKAYIAPTADGTGLADYYLKSEADRYIAHLKCKRCEAMAKWCERKRIDSANYRIPREKWQFYDKWNQRWLELAEKYREAK